jgi:SAM-dependent methyltransferase
MTTNLMNIAGQIRQKLNNLQQNPPNVIGNTLSDVDPELKQDLADFTGLPKDAVDALLARRPRGLAFTDEWVDTPAMLRHDHWFYLTSRLYLFANAIHPHAPGSGFLTEDCMREIVRAGGCVLDYAGGTGNSALTTGRLGYCSHYRELSSIQTEFVRFRAWKHKVNLTVHGWWEPLEEDRYDLVCFDSIGHVVDQRRTLADLVRAVKSGGALYLNLEDLNMPALYEVAEETRWTTRQGEQSMHIANQVGNVPSFLEEQRLRWVGPHWVKL